MKIVPVGNDLLHAEGWTGMTKLIVAFCSFANTPEEETAYG